MGGTWTSGDDGDVGRDLDDFLKAEESDRPKLFLLLTAFSGKGSVINFSLGCSKDATFIAINTHLKVSTQVMLRRNFCVRDLIQFSDPQATWCFETPGDSSQQIDA